MLYKLWYNLMTGFVVQGHSVGGKNDSNMKPNQSF